MSGNGKMQSDDVLEMQNVPKLHKRTDLIPNETKTERIMRLALAAGKIALLWQVDNLKDFQQGLESVEVTCTMDEKSHMLLITGNERSAMQGWGIKLLPGDGIVFDPYGESIGIQVSRADPKSRQL